jgi:guanylate cyclase
VIGRKKFIYDLWGDAVNTASRMESHSAPGKIQITRETYECIKDEFVCEPRGKVQVKGKGELETWYLIGVRNRPKETALT